MTQINKLVMVSKTCCPKIVQLESHRPKGCYKVIQKVYGENVGNKKIENLKKQVHETKDALER